FLLFIHCSHLCLHLHSFPTRRSSDLAAESNVPGLVSLSSSAFHIGSPLIDILTSAPCFNSLVTKKSGCSSTFPALIYILFSSKRSEEHTSELQSRFDLVCRLLLEKKK